MTKMYPRDFIQKVLIEEIGDLVNKQRFHYISFALIGIGIEFLGKCLDDKEKNWYAKGKSGKNFREALKECTSLSRYKGNKIDLYNKLRNGLAHSYIPKKGLALSHTEESIRLNTPHLIVNTKGNIVLVCEELYSDFKEACEYVLNKQFDKNGKMDKQLLEVPIVA